jgi:glycosyltransferase involved in cell wall biosynthesis
MMAEYLSSQGEDVLWWTGDYDHYGQRQRRHGNMEIPASDTFRIRYLSAKGYKKTKSIARMRYDRQVAAGFVALSGTYELPDVIIASMPSVDLALASVRWGKTYGVPVIVDIRDLHPDIFVEAAPAPLRPLMRVATWPMKTKVAEICREATAIWGNSDAFVEWGCRLGGRARGEHDFTLPIAYKPLPVDRTDISKVQGDWHATGLFLPDDLHIVFFGTLSKAFDFAPVFAAAQALSQSGTRHRFHIFGTGQQQAYVSAHCAGLLNCNFHGPVGATKLQAAMELSDIGIAPYIFSENFRSNMPNKTTEYLGGGLFVALAFKTGVLADFLRVTGSGFCYETAEELVAALSELDKDPEKMSKARHAARAAFEQNLDYETLSRKMHDRLRWTVDAYGG